MTSTPRSGPSFPSRHPSALAVALLGQAPWVRTGRAAPDDPIRVGLIGCGGRGTGAVLNVLGAATKVIYPQAGYHTEDVAEGTAATRGDVTVAALADVFPDRLAACRGQLDKLGMVLPDERCFVGFDAYRQLLAVPDVNYVILAAPPHFRPLHLRAAVEAGKHVFMEKPAGVDVPGVLSVIESGEIARRRGLGIVSGTQRRHEKGYAETIRRVQDGAIGEITSCRAYWNGGCIWVVEPRPGWSDMEWQLRNWNYFEWVGGDHIVEQHVHNLDIITWVLGRLPVRARGVGGRQARPNRTFGHIWDHFAVEFEYDNGLRCYSQCRQMDGCDGKVEEALIGTRGTSNAANWIRGENLTWRFRERDVNAYEQEHQDLIASIRAGQPLNEARALAESTLMGILGREAAYSGQVITWDQLLRSTKRLGPAEYAFGDLPFPEVVEPGAYRFV